MTFQKILVALDRSSQSRVVFEQALAQALGTGAELLLMHTIRLESDLATGPFLGIGTIADVNMYGSLRQLQQERLQQNLEQARGWLEPMRAEAIARGIVAEINCHGGEPSTAICDRARDWGADLIVIGRRGHQGLTEVVLGSVSNAVVHHAPCSVLVVQGVKRDLSATPEQAVEAVR